MNDIGLRGRITALANSEPLRQATRLKASAGSIESGREAYQKDWKLTDCPWTHENRDGWLLGYGLAAGWIIEGPVSESGTRPAA